MNRQKLVFRLIFVLALVGFLAWAAWLIYAEQKQDAGELAIESLLRADSLRADGDVAAAAELYREVVFSETRAAGDAMNRIRELLTGVALDATDPRYYPDVLTVGARTLAAVGEPLDTVIAEAARLADTLQSRDPAMSQRLSKLALDLGDAQDRVALDRHRTLIESLLKSDPDNPQFLSSLALTYAALEDWDACRELLAPHAENLGASEAARLLGRIYAEDDDHDAAYPLLKAYVDVHLEPYQVAKTRYQQAIEDVRADTARRLERGAFSRSFYQRYVDSDEAGRQELQEEFFQRRANLTPEFIDAYQELQRLHHVIDSAFRLGAVLVRKAQAATDTRIRTQWLRDAEQAFLATAETEGERDDYRLYLAQVYFWMGRDHDGEALVDAMLAKNERSFPALVYAALTLQEVGLGSRARRLAREAYTTARQDTERFDAARLNWSLAANDQDERIWLERSDPDNPRVQASLAGLHANDAARAGDIAEARRLYAQAIEIYDQQGESDAVLGSAATMRLRLFEIDGKIENLQRAANDLLAAAERRPTDGDLVFGAASALLAETMTAWVGREIDLVWLRQPGLSSHLELVYRQAARWTTFRQALADDPQSRHSAELLDQAMLLKPKNPRPYRKAWDLYRLTGNVAGMEALRDRATGTSFDTEELLAATRRFMARSDEGELVPELRVRIDRMTAAAGYFEKRRDSLQHAFFTALRVSTEQQLLRMGYDLDRDAHVRLARRVQALHASTQGNRVLTAALMNRLEAQWVTEHPDWRGLDPNTSRLVGGQIRLSVTLERIPAARGWLAGKADFNEAVALITSRLEDDPSAVSAGDWALLRYIRPGLAERIAVVLTSDRLAVAEQAVRHALWPADLATVLDAYWAAQLSGDDARARAILSAYRDLALPVIVPAFPLESS